MADTIEIKTYEYYTYSSRDSSTANTVIVLYGETGHIGDVFFGNSTDPLMPAEKLQSGTYSLHFHSADLPIIIDMLRNEKPVYLIYNGADNSRISTTQEPVGEGEEH